MKDNLKQLIIPLAAIFILAIFNLIADLAAAGAALLP